MKNYVMKGILVLLLLVVVAFGLEMAGLKWTQYFAPKKANVQRKVFEQTKSYVHGKIQDLAKYYKEYNEAENQDDKDSLATVIKMQFAEFDESAIHNEKLKRFLITARGY